MHYQSVGMLKVNKRAAIQFLSPSVQAPLGIKKFLPRSDIHLVGHNSSIYDIAFLTFKYPCINRTYVHYFVDMFSVSHLSVDILVSCTSDSLYFESFVLFPLFC